MCIPERRPPQQTPSREQGIPIQRTCLACEDELRRQPIAEKDEEEEILQPKEIPGQIPPVTPTLASQISGLWGRGRPLSESERAFFESRFDHEFSQVRIHTDALAAETAHALHAHAYTVGRHVVFGARRYRPGTAEGRKLLAHELTHVMQQTAPTAAPTIGCSAPPLIQKSDEDQGTTPWTGRLRRAEEIFRTAPRVRPLTEANFWNIFYDRNKVIVVDFWATWCRPCDRVAQHVVSLANRYASGPYSGLVKFYRVEWDPAVNPRIHRRFGFPSIPVVYFYYTATGRPPTSAAPLLEGSLAGIVPESEYVWRIETMLRRHGHGTAGAS
ncbi:MAG: DUF4157 domain-containing protein [Anaerolineae bacterium]